MWTIVGIASTALVAYLISCRLWPIRTCRRCEGSGKIRGPGGRTWRPCKRCGGSGGQPRIGHQVLAGIKRRWHNL